MKKIYADFMKTDYEGRLRLVCIGTSNDLAKLNVELSPGKHIVLYNDDVNDDGDRDDLIVEGVIEYNESTNEWAARIDFDAIKNESEISNDEMNRLSRLMLKTQD